MKEWERDEEFWIKIPKEQVCSVIREYYQEYEGFKGVIQFKEYVISWPDGFGFEDYAGCIDLILTENIIAFNQEIKKSTRIKGRNINLANIFSKYIEDDNFELSGKGYFDVSVDGNGDNINFKGVCLSIKKKSKEKVLKK